MEPAKDRKHRSHLRRRAPANNVHITDNDIRDIFEPLSRHAQLTTRQLVAFGSRHPVLTKARLGTLWHGTEGQRSHWLHRLNEDMLFANHLSVDDMHRLGSEAEALLRAKEIIPPGEWVANSRIGGNSAAPSRIIRLAHDHMASDIAIDIEIGARAAGAPYHSHVDIVQAAPPETRMQPKPLKIPVEVDGRQTFVEPDALFSISGRNFALEADKATESIKGVIVPKILAYREIVSAGVIDEYLGIDNLRVLFATTSETRMKNIMQELALIAKHGKSTLFCFRAESGFGHFLKTPAPTGRLFAASWQRVGCADLVIAEAES